MNSAWTVEFTRILVLIIVVIVVGFVSGEWLWTILLAGVTYISWTLIQIRAFERWIRLGAKTHLAPDTNGIWELIVQHIHRAQKKNTHHKKRLSGLAKRFEATIAALPDAAIVLNATLEIEWSNRAAFELLGIDEKKDNGQRLDNLIRNPLIQGLLEQDNLVNREIEMDSPTDQSRTLVLSCIDFGESQKLITARDISQRLAVQKMRKAFVANASHELRTPLTVVSGYLEILENDPDIPKMLKKQLHNASLQANRMQKILDDLLTLSKLEEKGHMKNAGDNVDISSLLTKLINDFRRTKAKGTHEIKISIEPGFFLKAVEIDIYSLCQNLLSNAVKYSPQGSIIQVKWEDSGNGYICLRVQDNGEGIAPENLSRLTERFYRVNVNRSKQIGGTGLGLSIVKHILENHGGYLDVESEIGRGSTFSACFPLHRVISRPNEQKQA